MQVLVVEDYTSDEVLNTKCSVLLILFLGTLHNFLLDDTED